MRFLIIFAITSLAFIGTALAGPIHDAAKAGDVAKVRQLLANGAKVDARAKSGRTPLHWAARGGHADVVKALLAAGAKVDARDKDGWTRYDGSDIGVPHDEGGCWQNHSGCQPY
jgi:ankyrin repeat protein